jgi:hypothetical protein
MGATFVIIMLLLIGPLIGMTFVSVGVDGVALAAIQGIDVAVREKAKTFPQNPHLTATYH